MRRYATNGGTEMMPMPIARYWQAVCSVHGETTFGHYYETMERLASGCLRCHFERQDREHDCVACPPRGAPTRQDVESDHDRNAEEPI